MPENPSADDPLYSGALKERADLTLAAILRALLVVIPVIIAAGALGASGAFEVAIMCAAFGFTLALFFLQRRGHFSLCVHAIAFGLIAIAAGAAAGYGSVRSAGTVGQVAAIAIAGIFLGRRALMLAVTLSVSSIAALIYAEHAGWLPVPNHQVTAAHWVIYSVIIAAVALVLSYMRALLLDVVRRLGDELEQRRKAEAARRQSEAHFSAAFTNSPDGILISRLRDGIVLAVNDAWCAINGFPRDVVVGRTVASLGIWTVEDRAVYVETLQREGRVSNFRATLRRADGRMRRTLLSAVRIEMDGEACVMSLGRDITELQHAERERQQSEAKYAAIFSSSPDPISITRERDSVTIEVNDAWVRITGHAREYAVGRSALKMGMWTEQGQRASVIEEMQAKGAVHNIPTRFTIAHGLTIDALLSGVRVTLDDEPCVVWSWREVTELRRAELEKSQALEKFSAVFETSPDAISVTRMSDGLLIEANDEMFRQAGVDRAAAIGRSVAELGLGLDPAERERLVAQLAAQGRIINHSTQLKRRSGAPLEVLLSAARLTLEGEACVVWSWRDVTEQRGAEEELRSNRRLLETVIDAIPMAIFAKDLDSNYIMLNKLMAEFFGVPKEKLLRRHTSKLPAGEAARSKSLEDDAWVFEHRRALDQPDQALERPDGVLMRYHSTKLPLFDEAGKLIGLLGINRDIGEEKRAQEALRDSEHRYRSLFQAAMDCILVISPQGAIVDVNEFGCRSLGYTREDLIGGTFTRILDETKLSRMLPRPESVKTERRALRAEQEVRAKDGSVRAVEFTAGPLPDGNILVVARDVSERRRSEKLLENIAKGVSSHTGAEFFRTLVIALCRELPAHMVFIAETAGRGDRVRTIACCVDGVLAENFEYMLAGSPCILAMERRGSVVHPQGVAQQFPADAALARRGIVGYAGTSLFDASGKAIGILVALTREPIERREFFVSMLEIFAARAAVEIERAHSDATVRELNISLERRVRERTAELEAANRDLDSFGYSVSHDLRSPLGALNGFAHLLRAREAERLSPEGAHLLRQLESNATRMTNLVEGLLEFSRLGRKPVTRIAVPMAGLVSEVVEELRAENRSQHLDFRVGGIPDAYGDAVLLRQVWRNLIGNAVKYSRGRDPAVVEVGFDEASKEYFVRDNGAGFDMQYAERLFGVFERLHGESEFEGTGIGLAIVQRVVNRHGGMVRGEGRPDEGATFRFTLPAR